MRKIIFGIIFLLAMASVYAETISYDDFECNGFGCGTGWNNNWTNTGTIEITTLSSPQGIYMLRATGGGNATRNFDNTGYTATTISFWATGTSLEAGDYCRYYYYNGATYTQLLQIADGQDTGTLQYYTYNITPVNANAGIRVQAVGSTGDYCYIDTITTSGIISMPTLNIILDAQYPIGKTNIEIDMTSTQTNTNYTLKLYDSSNNLFCEKAVVSPVVAQTTFSTYCNMPNSTHTNAYAIMYETSTPTNNITQYFNIVNYQQDYGKLKISQVYYSPQVLQGSSTELFAVIDTLGVSISKLYVTITFPDNATRKLSMERTINDGEYRAFITDTFRTAWTTFEIRVESGIYYDTYINQYYVVPFSVEYVANVGSVSTVTNPVTAEMPSLKLHGTEYIPGDLGKMFLQFLDANNNAVSNSECFLSIWYPNDTILLNNTLMSKLQNASDGIYYKNFNVPNVAGVYPASAKCYEPLTFDYNALPTYANDGFESGTYLGGTGWANDTSALPNYGWDIEDTVPLATIVTNASAVCYQGLYCAKYTGSYGFIERGVRLPDGASAINISFAIKFKGFQTSETCELWLFDGNWHKLESYNLNTNMSNNVWYVKNKYLTASEYELGTILIGYYLSSAPSTGDECYIDSVNVAVIAPNITITNDTVYQILRGSGEVHVSNLYTQLNSSIITPEQVWNYTNRNLTYYPPQVDMTNYTRIDAPIYAINQSINTNIDYTRNNLTTRIDLLENVLSNIMYAINNSIITEIFAVPLNVWTYATRNLTYYEHIDMTNYSLISNLTAQEVWEYSNRNLTYYPPIDTNAVAVAVWNHTTRNLTYYPAQTDLTNYSLINQGVWAYIDRNLTYYPPQVDLTNYSAIESGVWTYVNRNLTYYPVQQDLTNYTLISEGVWTYIDRNLTYYPPQVDMTNYSGIAASVWNYTTRDLTYYQINNITASDVWNYINRTLSYYEVNNITATDVWTYNNRTLTYYPTQEDLTNYTFIWEYPNRNLTYYEPAYVNTTAIAENTWNYTARYTHGIILN